MQCTTTWKMQIFANGVRTRFLLGNASNEIFYYIAMHIELKNKISITQNSSILFSESLVSYTKRKFQNQWLKTQNSKSDIEINTSKFELENSKLKI